VAEAFARFSQLCSTHSVRIFVHEASLQDVARDKNITRRKITESKIEKFEVLRGVPTPSQSELERRFGTIVKHNDLIDCTLLFALEQRVVAFLVTQDAGLQKRATAHGLGGRVFTVEEAVEWLRQAYEPKNVVLPYIEDRYCYEISSDDPMFNTLRADYPQFDAWFRDKCVATHRKCWRLAVGGETAGLLIWKNEEPGDTTAKLAGDRILKICTFKVSDRYLGEKFGELLLKQVLWFAQRNRYQVTYVTVYPRHVTLVSLLEEFGFRRTLGDASLGEELQYEKAMGSGPVADVGSPLALDREHYPRFVDDARVRILCVPIRPAYHRLLFPEKAEMVRPTLFGVTDATRAPGNTIRKVYLCRSTITKMSPGDVLLFYMSKDPEYLYSQTMASVGVVVDVEQTCDIDELFRMTAKRSVYPDDELRAMLAEKETPLKVIDFLLVGHFDAPVPWKELKAISVLNAPPQSIVEVDRAAYGRLEVYERLGFAGTA
jgi:GNAT superfamily N-acetyltransferase